ncbi:hypothetical protein BDF14DRAFT_1724977 [Spinellus fusiger]|nr:hypothetical protein BDF14DRAFT_1724977 [Spinellus fusiger]
MALVSYVVSVVIVVGPVIGYFHQYMIIRRNQSSKGFSSKTCALLFISSESIATSINTLGSQEALISCSSHPPHPWHRQYYRGYLQCLCFLAAILTLLSVPFGKSSLFLQGMAWICLGLDTVLPVPQLLSNYHRRSTAGFSGVLLSAWLTSDSAKLFYFLFTNPSPLYTICSGLQLLGDSLLFLEWCVLSSKARQWLGTVHPMLLATHVSDSDSDSDPYESIP